MSDFGILGDGAPESSQAILVNVHLISNTHGALIPGSILALDVRADQNLVGLAGQDGAWVVIGGGGYGNGLGGFSRESGAGGLILRQTSYVEDGFSPAASGGVVRDVLTSGVGFSLRNGILAGSAIDGELDLGSPSGSRFSLLLEDIVAGTQDSGLSSPAFATTLMLRSTVLNHVIADIDLTDLMLISAESAYDTTAGPPGALILRLGCDLVGGVPVCP
jgi:hypothetical protein